MIHIELTIDDLDYDALVEQYLPEITEKLRQSGSPAARLLSTGMSPSIAKTIVRRLSREEKDRFLAELINQNSAKLSRSIESGAAQKRVKLTVKSLKARS